MQADLVFPWNLSQRYSPYINVLPSVFSQEKYFARNPSKGAFEKISRAIQRAHKSYIHTAVIHCIPIITKLSQTLPALTRITKPSSRPKIIAAYLQPRPFVSQTIVQKEKTTSP